MVAEFHSLSKGTNLLRYSAIAFGTAFDCASHNNTLQHAKMQPAAGWASLVRVAGEIVVCIGSVSDDAIIAGCAATHVLR